MGRWRGKVNPNRRRYTDNGIKNFFQNKSPYIKIKCIYTRTHTYMFEGVNDGFQWRKIN